MRIPGSQRRNGGGTERDEIRTPMGFHKGRVGAMRVMCNPVGVRDVLGCLILGCAVDTATPGSRKVAVDKVMWRNKDWFCGSDLLREI